MATSDFERVKQGIEKLRQFEYQAERDISGSFGAMGFRDAAHIAMNGEEPSGLRRRALLAMGRLSVKRTGEFVRVGRSSAGDPKLQRAAVFHLTQVAQRAVERGDTETLRNIQTGLEHWMDDAERPDFSKLAATLRFHLPKPEEASEPNPGLDPNRNRVPAGLVRD